jgi:hypothetical protein
VVNVRDDRKISCQFSGHQGIGRSSGLKIAEN